MRIIAVRLSDIIANNGKEDVNRYLEKFRCSKDIDLQDFLHNKAVMYENKGRSRTYLLVDTDDEDRIIGYVTLALTKITVSDRTELAKGIVRRMDLNDNETVGYLIGQMAKDDSVFKSIGGKMLSFAQNMLYVSYRQNGGRAICIDCKEPMIEYYRKEGFILVEPEPDKRNGLYRLVRLF